MRPENRLPEHRSKRMTADPGPLHSCCSDYFSDCDPVCDSDPVLDIRGATS